MAKDLGSTANGVWDTMQRRKEYEATTPWLLAKVRRYAAARRAGAIGWSPKSDGGRYYNIDAVSFRADQVPTFLRWPKEADVAELERINAEIAALQAQRLTLIQKAWRRARPATVPEIEEASREKRQAMAEA